MLRRPRRPPGGVRLHRYRPLALLVAVLAALGVLNSVLMATRKRVHGLGVFKAAGVSPR